MYLIRNVLAPLQREIDHKFILAQKLGIRENRIEKLIILRKAIDARKRNHLKINFTLIAEINGKIKLGHEVKKYIEPIRYIVPNKKISEKRPFIIGAGPSGLFCALSLLEKGFLPIIFERGKKLENRVSQVQDFWEKGFLDPESNVQFGEGGAGTFSDGKLTSRSRDFYTQKIFDLLIRFGADEKIKYEAQAHLGSDRIRSIIKNIREFLIKKGCEFRWQHKMEELKIKDGKVVNVRINQQNYSPEILIIALGNSARDTFEILSSKIKIQNKPFAVGFRIEHPQEFINKIFYGEKTDFSLSGNASYRLAAKSKNKGIYSFCMCPGGFVIPASSEQKMLALNGMSYAARDNKFANSALVVTVDERDFGQKKLAGIYFQRQIESSCFSENHPYFAPAQDANSFIGSERKKSIRSNSYKPGVIKTDFAEIFPANIVNELKMGLQKFDKKAPGFIEKGMLFAPETRTSSPVRLSRDHDQLNAEKIKNLFPIGEGAGYSGGIISSAADGYKLGMSFQPI